MSFTGGRDGFSVLNELNLEKSTSVPFSWTFLPFFDYTARICGLLPYMMTLKPPPPHLFAPTNPISITIIYHT